MLEFLALKPTHEPAGVCEMEYLPAEILPSRKLTNKYIAEPTTTSIYIRTYQDVVYYICFETYQLYTLGPPCHLDYIP